jgi:copper chaperone CopZ
LLIKKALEGLEGVEKANISYDTKMGEVLYNPEKVSETEIVNKVNQIGFKAKVIEQKSSPSEDQ